ncbi:hypothetical protein SASPL_148006 [Salvia splendens]|uniref:NmrA-like domain-containing protein n=2 Tax=Salvia splendens TaxID=180675 RepID=A0A8X8W9G4_SALSN|nr:hypothetical protein SASPL_148006 [Salvia splendens]
MARPTSTAPSTATTTALQTFSSSNQQPHIRDSLVLKLKLPKKKVSWKEGTVDNEFMNKKSSKKCCIFHKEKPFDEDDSDADCDHDHDHQEASTSRSNPNNFAVGRRIRCRRQLHMVRETPGGCVGLGGGERSYEDEYEYVPLFSMHVKPQLAQARAKFVVKIVASIKMEKNESKSKILIVGGSGYVGGYIGMLDEHEKLVSVIKEVDVVISAVAYPQILDQLKILEAIKLAGNIKRFVPSGYGVDEDKEVSVLPAFESVLEKKRRIRRAIEEAKIPYTYEMEITVYGDGEAKFVMTYEDDIGLCTIKAANDPRAKEFQKIHIHEEEVVALSQKLPEPENIPVAILHGIFIKGATTSHDFAENDAEASALYPDMKFTTVDELLDIFIEGDAPKPASAAF